MDAGMTDGGMTDAGAADAGVAAAGMQRPRRQAAVAAMENIRRVREWEEMNESSKRFRECAAQIDSEFRAEEKQRAVRSEDLDPDGEDEAESGDESEDAYFSANDSFVSDDGVSEASEYTPCNAEAQEADEEEDADNEDAEDAEDAEECVSEDELESEDECLLSQARTPLKDGPDAASGGAGDAA
jgi:hypothetical protein